MRAILKCESQAKEFGNIFTHGLYLLYKAIVEVTDIINVNIVSQGVREEGSYAYSLKVGGIFYIVIRIKSQ